MPKINPTSLEDLLDFVTNHKADIRNGTYGVLIKESWIENIPEDIALFLVRHNPISQEVFSKSLYTSVNLLKILAEDSNPDIRREVAANPNSPNSVLELLAKDENSRIRSAVASHPNVSVQALKVLARDSDSDIPALVAKNPNTPPDLLAILAPSHPAAVAENPNTPENLLATLAENIDHNTGYLVSAIANNPNASSQVRTQAERKYKQSLRAFKRSQRTIKDVGLAVTWGILGMIIALPIFFLVHWLSGSEELGMVAFLGMEGLLIWFGYNVSHL